MNKQELINEISERTRQGKSSIGQVLDAFAAAATEALQAGEEVVLPGIGKLKTKQSAARTGRNPATGEEMEIPAKTAVKFVAIKALKDAVA